MAAAQGAGAKRFVVIHIATTCDEHGVYVTKDSAETIELGWILLDANNLEELHRDSVLVRPVNTGITPLCTSLTTLTWDQVRNAGTFRDAINRFDQFAQEYLLTKDLEDDFIFVTLDPSDLRVQLPREARDKSVVLPAYLQHSRTFDLRTEYQRWQLRHPESLPFGSSALSNICAALEVDPVQSSEKIKHNLPFHLQALAPSYPCRAMDEAVTLTRVLRGLMKKSQPPEDHPDVLTRPLDARADVRAFLSERSKVLHMSGLPHDTTQSELESWFTQYGGRPIAFWTLKTTDQNKPTGTGFAIFSSHEEAAESLCMNGRALSERVVEISPSSNRVLDRAADILTSFPPSKNRPRPGDWTCPSCGFSNFQRRTACFRCSYSPMGDQQQPPHMYGRVYAGHSGMMPHHHGMHMGHGHMGAIPGMGRGGGESRIPFRAGDWRCGSEHCSYHNFAKNISCLRCGASRANAAVGPGDLPLDGPGPYAMASSQLAGLQGAPPPYNASYGGQGSAYANGINGPHMNYSPVGQSYTHGPGPPVMVNSFDGRAEAAFAAAGPNGYTNGYTNGDSMYDASSDASYNFLSAGLGKLSVGAGDEARRATNKSPA